MDFNQGRKILLADIIISIVTIAGMASGAFFQGALTDVYSTAQNPWIMQIFIALSIGIILFVIQLFLFAKRGQGQN